MNPLPSSRRSPYRSWSYTLKLAAAVMLLVTRDTYSVAAAGVAAAALLGAGALDVLDWRAERRAPVLSLAAVVLLLTAAGFALVRAWQGPPVPTVEVPEFGFRLRRPGPDWQLRSKAELPSPEHDPNAQAG